MEAAVFKEIRKMVSFEILERVRSVFWEISSLASRSK